MSVVSFSLQQFPEYFCKRSRSATSWRCVAFLRWSAIGRCCFVLPLNDIDQLEANVSEAPGAAR